VEYDPDLVLDELDQPEAPNLMKTESPRPSRAETRMALRGDGQEEDGEGKLEAKGEEEGKGLGVQAGEEVAEGEGAEGAEGAEGEEGEEEEDEEGGGKEAPGGAGGKTKVRETLGISAWPLWLDRSLLHSRVWSAE
jgi:hypothetical protein